jgi:hypothetical protein
MSPALETVLEAAEQLADQLEDADLENEAIAFKPKVIEIRQAVALIRGTDQSAILTVSHGQPSKDVISECMRNPGVEIEVGRCADNNVAHRVRVNCEKAGLKARTKTRDRVIHVFACYPTVI